MVMFTIVYGVGAALEFLGHRGAWIAQSIQFAVFLVVVGCLLRARSSVNFRRFLYANLGGVMLATVLMAFVATIILGGALIGAFIAFHTNLMWVLLVGVLAWPLAALVYLAEDPAPTVGRLVFPYPWAAEPAWREIFSDL